MFWLLISDALFTSAKRCVLGYKYVSISHLQIIFFSYFLSFHFLTFILIQKLPQISGKACSPFKHVVFVYFYSLLMGSCLRFRVERTFSPSLFNFHCRIFQKLLRFYLSANDKFWEKKWTLWESSCDPSKKSLHLIQLSLVLTSVNPLCMCLQIRAAAFTTFILRVFNHHHRHLIKERRYT